MAKDLKLIRRNNDLIIRFRDRNSQFVINWIELLGWDADPFQNRIFHPEEDFIAGYAEQRKKLNLFLLRDQKVAFIIGEPGFGKTQLLSWMDYELSFDKKVKTKFLKAGKASLQTFKRKLMHSLLPKKERFITFLYYRAGFRNLPPFLSKDAFKKFWLEWIPRVYIRIFHKPFIALEDSDFPILMSKYLGDKHFVLLLDDATDLSLENITFIQSLLSQGLPFHIIIADTHERLNKSIWKKINPQVNIDLPGMSYDDLKELLQKRIEAFNGAGIYPLVESQIKEIFKKAEYNPQKVLELARDVVIQFVVEKVRKKQDAPSSSQGIPEIQLKEGGGVYIEKVIPAMLPPEQQKALSEYERKAQRSLLRLSKEFSSDQPIETYYDEQEKKDIKKEEKKKPTFTREQVSYEKPKKLRTRKEVETEDALAALAKEFDRKKR